MAEIDTSEYTVSELRDEIEGIDSEEELRAVLEDEKENKDRKTAKDAIQSRLDEVSSDESGVDETDSQEEEEEEDDGLTHPTNDKKHMRALENGDYRDMWVYCETQQGELLDVSKEMLGKARELMDTYNDDYDEDEKVIGVLIGDEISDLAEDVVAYGADTAVYMEDESLARFLHKPYTHVFAEMARSSDFKSYDKPRYVLFPATNNGRDLSAQVQAELDSGLASDCNELYIEDHEETNPMKTGERGTKKTFEKVLHMKRPDFSGFEWSTILCLDNPDREFHPQGASVIPGSFPVPEKDEDREGEIVDFDADLKDEWYQVDIVDYDVKDEGLDLNGHDVIVALGRGIGDDPTRGIELGLELVDAFDDAALGLSRGVVTASYNLDGHVEEYVAEERQIGETGQVVEPKVYIAAGISGAIQHKVGMDDSDTIIAVNTDKEAEIKDFSDYFIVGDLFEVLPQLKEGIESGEIPIKTAADGGEQ